MLPSHAQELRGKKGCWSLGGQLEPGEGWSLGVPQETWPRVPMKVLPAAGAQT